MLDFFFKKLKLGYFLQSVKWNKSPQPTRNTSTEEKNHSPEKQPIYLSAEHPELHWSGRLKLNLIKKPLLITVLTY